MIAAGTGVGGAVIAHGKLVRGHNGFAGEIGHMPCNQAAGIPCVCGGSGHLELVASGSGIEARYAEIAGESLSGAEISHRAASGDDAAHKVIMRAGIALGEAIAGVTNLLDPDKVIIGGSVLGAGSAWRAAVQQGFLRQIPRRSRICPSWMPSWAMRPRLWERRRTCWIFCNGMTSGSRRGSRSASRARLPKQVGVRGFTVGGVRASFRHSQTKG